MRPNPGAPGPGGAAAQRHGRANRRMDGHDHGPRQRHRPTTVVQERVGRATDVNGLLPELCEHQPAGKQSKYKD